MLLKPNYILSSFEKPNSNDECKVLLNNKLITVKNSDILTIQF